jgi:hypothetical protein
VSITGLLRILKLAKGFILGAYVTGVGTGFALALILRGC